MTFEILTSPSASLSLPAPFGLSVSLSDLFVMMMLGLLIGTLLLPSLLRPLIGLLTEWRQQRFYERRLREIRKEYQQRLLQDPEKTPQQKSRPRDQMSQQSPIPQQSPLQRPSSPMTSNDWSAPTDGTAIKH